MVLSEYLKRLKELDLFCPHVKNQQNIIFAANRHGALLIMARPQTFHPQKAEYQTFLLSEALFFSAPAI
jgi:hypothetical protein